MLVMMLPMMLVMMHAMTLVMSFVTVLKTGIIIFFSILEEIGQQLLDKHTFTLG